MTFSLISLASSAAFWVALVATFMAGLETVSSALWKLVDIELLTEVAMDETDVFSDDHDFPSSSTVDGVDPASFIGAPIPVTPWLIASLVGFASA